MTTDAETDLVATPAILRSTPDLRHAVRRLRWFRSAFDAQVRALEEATGTGFQIDKRRVAQAFVTWIRALDSQGAWANDDRRGFTHFTCGLMVRALMTKAPLTHTSPPHAVSEQHPAHLWPEGYAYVTYALNVCAAVLQEEFGESLAIDPLLNDPRTWESFRENVAKDPNMAIPFFELFSGATPNWSAPSLFSPRESSAARRRNAARKAAPELDAAPGSGSGRKSL